MESLGNSMWRLGCLTWHGKKCSLAYGVSRKEGVEGICCQEQIGAGEEIIKLHSVTRYPDLPFTLLCATGGWPIWIALMGSLASWLLVVFGTDWTLEGGRRVKLEYLFPRLSLDGLSTGSSCFPLLKATAPIKPHSSHCSLSLALRVDDSSLLLLFPGYYLVSCEVPTLYSQLYKYPLYEILPTLLNLSMPSVSCPDLNW